jgi:hypothetical protein
MCTPTLQHGEGDTSQNCHKVPVSRSVHCRAESGCSPVAVRFRLPAPAIISATVPLSHYLKTTAHCSEVTELLQSKIPHLPQGNYVDSNWKCPPNRRRSSQNPWEWHQGQGCWSVLWSFPWEPKFDCTMIWINRRYRRFVKASCLVLGIYHQLIH